ncbi:MAG TPA: hypothetical protein VGO45_05295, partial [Bacteroidia bacterium]|nr:hypothetical protein [Bacteroidia bacterium]
MKTFYCIFISFFFFSLVTAQNKDSVIVFSKDAKLTWLDFKGEPRHGSFLTAESCIRISYSVNEDSGKVKVRAQFVKYSSWHRDKSTNDMVLNHEQLHFDIAELYAREFRKILSEYKFHKTRLDEEVARLFNANFNEMNEIEQKYDRKTVHGIKKGKQAFWDENIRNQLDDLDSFSNPSVQINWYSSQVQNADSISHLPLNSALNYEFPSFDLLFGQKLLLSNHFYGQFNTLGSSSFNRPLQFVGVDFVAYFSESPNAGTNHVSYCQIIPQEIIVQNKIKVNVTGFITSFEMGKVIVGGLKHFELSLTGGANTGRLRLYGNDSLREKNPFFSPVVSIKPRIKLGKLVLSLRLDYEYDISGENWRRIYFAKLPQVNLNTLNQTGFSWLLGLGYTWESTPQIT